MLHALLNRLRRLAEKSLSSGKSTGAVTRPHEAAKKRSPVNLAACESDPPVDIPISREKGTAANNDIMAAVSQDIVVTNLVI
jgi:hypothetical protein